MIDAIAQAIEGLRIGVVVVVMGFAIVALWKGWWK